MSVFRFFCGVPRASSRWRESFCDEAGDQSAKMAAQVELCCLDSFPSHICPYDALMLNCHLDSLLQNDTDPPTLLFTPHRAHGSRRRDILLRVHPSTEEETAGSRGGFTPQTEPRVRLFTSSLFLEHHGLQRHGSTGTVRPMEPVTLERVVLGSRSKQSHRWAGTERFSTGLLELCRPGQWLLARLREPLVLPGHPGLGEDPEQVRGRRC